MTGHEQGPLGPCLIERTQWKRASGSKAALF
jgi:hypothetical protein